MKVFLFLFIFLPILEMVVLIKIGNLIGAWNAVGLVILSTLVGFEIIRRLGFRSALNIHQKIIHAHPVTDMLENITIAISGLLLLIPGFITDLLGIIILILPVRRWLIQHWLEAVHFKVRQANIYDSECHRESSDPYNSVDPNLTIEKNLNYDVKKDHGEKKDN